MNSQKDTQNNAIKIYSCSFTGLDCNIVEVETDISNGLSAFSIVGLGDTSVQESKERVRSSIKNSGATFPPTKKTVNLAPAELRKQGTQFDLPIATGLLLASEQIKTNKIKNSIILGELSLNGDIKKINGVLAIAHHIKQKGFKKLFLPKENAKEAAFIDDIEIFPLENFREFIAFCNDEIEIKEIETIKSFEFQKNYSSSALEKIIGLNQAKRAISISATGGHNLLMNGPPGMGKTILARALKDLLPKMTKTEILETSKIFSIAGLLEERNPIIIERPFREVHHTASIISIIGGGTFATPGEISLAHNGVLFFDEITEFPIKVIESLRQPLEDKHINITRIHYSTRFPSNFIFVATMNPCPCGYFTDKKIKCICSENQINNYKKKLSGPILDRFDINIEINDPPKNILSDKSLENYEEIFSKIKKAFLIQNQRFKNEKINKNADMDFDNIKKYCSLNKENQSILEQAREKLNLSNRSYLKTVKIARTIADLEESSDLKETHILEALNYRKR